MMVKNFPQKYAKENNKALMSNPNKSLGMDSEATAKITYWTFSNVLFFVKKNWILYLEKYDDDNFTISPNSLI